MARISGTVSGLDPETTYEFQVRVVDAFGNPGDWSNVARGTTLALGSDILFVYLPPNPTPLPENYELMFNRWTVNIAGVGTFNLGNFTDPDTIESGAQFIGYISGETGTYNDTGPCLLIDLNAAKAAKGSDLTTITVAVQGFWNDPTPNDDSPYDFKLVASTYSDKTIDVDIETLPGTTPDQTAEVSKSSGSIATYTYEFTTGLEYDEGSLTAIATVTYNGSTGEVSIS